MNKEKPGIYLFFPHPGFSEQHFIKDVGLVPWLMHKHFGFDANIVCVDGPHRSSAYLNSYVKGLNTHYVPNSAGFLELRDDYIAFMEQNISKIDILFLFGPYEINTHLILRYRRLRERGKVYLALDANNYFVDVIPWRLDRYKYLMSNCDVIATSCRLLQSSLNKKLPYTVEYMPNGFYNFTGRDITADLESKKNIILTVGRIGTGQKNNQVLLEAFAQVEKHIPDWHVRLVGNIDPAFEPSIEEYFQRYPHLRERVIFTGLVSSKEQLYKEYEQAKVFCLTSVMEGAPNVAAEALVNGCYMITSDVDACDDIVGNGKCGRVTPINDVQCLADTLLQVCQDPQELMRGGKEAVRHAYHDFNWDRNIRRLHHLLMR